MNARRLMLGCLAVLCVLADVLVLGVSSASALPVRHQEFESASFSQPGAFIDPTGVAVDQETGNVYVVDSNADVVDVFGAEGGSPTDGVPAQITGLDFFRNVAQGVVVDNACYDQDPRLTGLACEAFDPSNGDVYVAEETGEEVLKYKLNTASGEYELVETLSLSGEPNGVAVDTNGNVYITEYEKKPIVVFNSTGVEVGEIEQNTFTNPSYLAIGIPGVVYVGSEEERGVEELKVSSTYGVEGETSLNSTGEAVAVDSHGNVYVDDGSYISEYDSSGVLSEEFGSGRFESSQGVAVNDETGYVYVSNRDQDNVVAFGLPVVIPIVDTLPASGLTETGTKLHGTVDPEGEELTECHFEYGTTAGVYTNTVPCEQTPAQIGAGTAPVTVSSADLSGLQGNTTYHYRLTVVNADVTEHGLEATFTIPTPIIESTSFANLTETAVDLNAVIDPNNSSTTYRFEYGTSSAYGTSIPVPNAGIGSGTTGQAVTQHVTGLSQGTTYHYRVVAENAAGTTTGSDHTFLYGTPAIPVGGLPDGREWEMVSPPDKGDAGIKPIPIEEGGVQAAEDGGALSYVADVPLPSAEGSLGAGASADILAARGGKEWKSTEIQTPQVGADGAVAGGEGLEYRLFSSDLSLGLVQPFTESLLAEPPLSPPALPGEIQENTLYLRADAEVGPPSSSAEELERYEEASGNGAVEHSPGYLPLVTAANVPAGTKFGPRPQNGLTVGFVNATPDLSHVVLQAKNGVVLTKEAAGPESNLYEWEGVKGTPSGQLKLVSVLPEGAAASAPVLGNKGEEMRHAISNDGSRVIWTNESTEGKHLYLRDTISGETVQVDSAQGIKEPTTGYAQFQTASSNGNRIFFTDRERLTANSTALGESESEGKTEGLGDLYVFEVNEGTRKLSGTLTDLTVDPHYSEDGEHADVQGVVIGSSEDGSYVYFVADGALAPEAEPGNCLFGGAMTISSPSGATCNLYVEHYDSTSHNWEAPKLIAILSGEDQGDWGLGPAGKPLTNLTGVTARVSPDGEYLAFMSERPLTGYDNLDANSGVPDEEVYLYDAGSERLVCASCDPTGARPVGVFDSQEADDETRLLVDQPDVWNEHWLAGSVPGWTPDSATYSIYQSRYLSDSGRLFFDSPDDLVPRASNGKEDVYEFEPAGVGSCTGVTSSEGVTYSAPAGGCVGLISSGESSEESAFLDASANGDDVFFVTTSQLVPEDTEDKFAVYDAHVCSAAAPCFPQAAAVPPACTDGASCKAAPTPQPSIFGAPSSQTFSGQGNATPPPVSPTKAAKPKPLTRAQKLAKALKVCKKKAKKKRAGCEKQARKRFGAKAKKKLEAKKANAKKSSRRGG